MNHVLYVFSISLLFFVLLALFRSLSLLSTLCCLFFITNSFAEDLDRDGRKEREGEAGRFESS